MSINATSNYMSNADIMAWMETKTDDLYGNLRESMATADARADAESTLNGIKSQLSDLKSNGKDITEVREAIDGAIKQYGTEFPEAGKALAELGANLDAKSAEAIRAAWVPGGTDTDGNPQPGYQGPTQPVKLSSDEIDRFSKPLGDAVDVLGKKDQLSMINIQEINALLNQAKQTASALMDAADKSANVIINHIS
jgi:hypothetical protein